jgi:hypothetical protein
MRNQAIAARPVFSVAQAGAGDALVLGGAGGTRRESPVVLVRSLAVVALFAAGLGALANRYGGEIGAMKPTVATMANLLVMPKPRLQQAAVIRTEPIAVKEAVPDLDTELGSGAVDRVSYDALLSLGTAAGDPNEILEFGPIKIRRHLVQTIVRAAHDVQIDPSLLMAIADKESSFSTAVQARTSSATGLFQFIERTWLRVLRDFGAQHDLAREAALITVDDDGNLAVTDAAERARILEMRRDPAISAMLAAEMLKRDSARIAGRIGRPLSFGETYLAHFLGPDDAERFMAKVVAEPKAQAAALLPKPARANRTIFYAKAGKRKVKSLSVAEVHEKFEAMMSTRSARYRDVGAVSGSSLAYAEAGLR